MKTFLKWCEEKKLDLTVQENKIRTGLNTAMPTGYVSHEYPDAYFYPSIGTAPLNLQNQRRYVKDKAPPDNAP